MDLLKQINELPPEISQVLEAEAERSENGGPPLDEVLGISPAAARKRLERARRELLQKLRGGAGVDEEHKYSNAGEPRQGEEEEEEDDDGWE